MMSILQSPLNYMRINIFVNMHYYGLWLYLISFFFITGKKLKDVRGKPLKTADLGRDCVCLD